MDTKRSAKGTQGFIVKRKHKVFDYLMRHNNITLYSISRVFNLTEQQTLKYIHNPFMMDLRQLSALAPLFHVKPSVLFELIYCNYTNIPIHVAEEIDKDFISMANDIGL